ncbi:MAG TPA: L,D-transpeptidase family protein, partial [Haliangiales bacterium]|nr:L,D-transpeptidase family protein [Haliangiales bacterium]
TPSPFGGLIDPPLPLAWAQSRKDLGAKVAVRAGPDAADPIVAQLLPRTPVLVLAADADVARVLDGFVRLADLHMARAAAPPDEVGPDERWIDVDLDEQVLVAYEGTRPAYATLVSTGKPRFPTPEGIYRIWLKYAETDMNGQMGDEQPYSVATVPWTMFFARDLGFHTAYWHDRFGEARSHGCVNLAPRDARWLYFWAAPDVPSGWSMVQGIVERPGSVVRIRSAKVPDPEHRGYARFVTSAAPH